MSLTLRITICVFEESLVKLGLPEQILSMFSARSTQVAES